MHYPSRMSFSSFPLPSCLHLNRNHCCEGKMIEEKQDEVMVLINSVLLLWMIFCLSYSFVAGSRCCLCGLRVQTEPGDRGSTQTPLNPPSLLLSSSHPCPPPHPTPPVHLFIFSFPPSHSLSVQSVDCGIISSLLSCLYDALQHPSPMHTSDHSSRAAGGGRGGRGGKKKKKSGAGSVMLSMYLTSVPVRVFTETEGEE